MKTRLLLIPLIALLLLPALFAGCGSKSQDSGANNAEVQQAEHETGFAQGYDAGYQKGYADGKSGVKDATLSSAPEGSTDFVAGYGEGYGNGYEAGYTKAEAEVADSGGNQENEKAAVEAAMLEFVRNNATPGLQFKIENIVIHDSDAAGIAVCTSEKLENALVIMKKEAGVWRGVDFGTGMEPPSWYPY